MKLTFHKWRVLAEVHFGHRMPIVQIKCRQHLWKWPQQQRQKSGHNETYKNLTMRTFYIHIYSMYCSS